jgi:cytochrome b involved in lipid metabolism
MAPAEVTPSKVVVSSSTARYALSDVAKHATEMDCWTVVRGYVYDVTKFIPSHPGGKEIIKACGKDATTLFDREDEHAEKNAQGVLDSFFIGVLQTQ